MGIRIQLYLCPSALSCNSLTYVFTDCRIASFLKFDSITTAHLSVSALGCIKNKLVFELLDRLTSISHGMAVSHLLYDTGHYPDSLKIEFFIR